LYGWVQGAVMSVSSYAWPLTPPPRAPRLSGSVPRARRRCADRPGDGGARSIRRPWRATGPMPTSQSRSRSGRCSRRSSGWSARP